jgi:hypothetical protein
VAAWPAVARAQQTDLPVIDPQPTAKALGIEFPTALPARRRGD